MGTERDQAVDHRLEVVETKLEEIMGVLYGKSGEHMGLVTRIQVMWHSYVWLIGLLGAGLGSAVTLIVKRFV